MFVIGCTSQPWEGDLKSLSSCFHRRLFLPYPQYSSVLMLWKTALADVLRPYKRHLPAEFDVSSLAHISIGYATATPDSLGDGLRWPRMCSHRFRAHLTFTATPLAAL